VIFPFPKRKLKKQRGKANQFIMVNDDHLNAELFAWKQKKLEEGKFPCQCGHFESSHVRGLCILCHGGDSKTDPKYGDNCWHYFKQMDNLSLIEHMAQHKKDIEK
jgi:hypothetical protein